MTASEKEIMEYVEQEDVRFIRLVFCDIHGNQKNIAIMPDELPRAFSEGIAFDASAIDGFSGGVGSDLFLFPIPTTMSVLPWRSINGKVIRMFCNIKHSDGTQFESDPRYILKRAVEKAKEMGLTLLFGTEFEFYLFKTDDRGEPTSEPFDRAGYMDVAPEDRGENVRREICLTLTEMGIRPESSHHEEGPSQNEIDFRYSEAMAAAENALNFITVVKAVASRNGLYADFSPKPIPGESGNGLHINISVSSKDGNDCMDSFMAGIMAHANEMTAFLNPVEGSYARLGEKKAPKYVAWAPENRTQFIRIPAARNGVRRFELRSPDPMLSPYIAFALLIRAGIDGIEKKMVLPEPVNEDLYTAGTEVTDKLVRLPENLDTAKRLAAESDFIKSVLPKGYIPEM